MARGSPDELANLSYTEFRLLAFPGFQESRRLLAIPFFFLFVMIVTTNSLLIYLVKTEKSLHSPMYLLIALLFAVNIGGAINILPRMLLSFLLGATFISLTSCLTQMFFIYAILIFDCNVLLLMALDRYVAICHPLRYADIMTWKLLVLLIFVSLLRSVAFVTPVVILASQVSFCHSDTIGHFACEHMALMRLSCGDISRNKIVGMVLRSVTIAFDISFLLASYSQIFHAALKIASGSAQNKAFHTCGTHLIVIIIAYSTTLSSSIVFRVAKTASEDVHNLISAIYLLFPWAINPVIYGVRTKEIRDNLIKFFQRRSSVLGHVTAASLSKR
ncbi:olfactory receptor 52K1-like [Tiliqua scincoides]|uniref:olfactory receptor 52K1-like n=1 Tax=Tiliqua scincoides TaxID=71010 RepID=UPI003462F962